MFEHGNITTAQELITPVPAAAESVQAGSRASISSDRNAVLVDYLAETADNATSLSMIKTSVNSNSDRKSEIRYSGYTNPEEKGKKGLLNAEEETFKLLGEKLMAAYKVAYKATNIHKPIRENLNCAFALYQELKEQRRELSEYMREPRGPQKSEATQTDNTILYENNRTITESPEQEQKRKKAKNISTMAVLESQQDINICIQEEENISQTENAWQTVKHRKETKKKTKVRKKPQKPRDIGEALVLKTNASESYADVIKEMKKKINPSDIGVQITGIRRTREGELLLKLSKGEGQADKLKSVISNVLGENVMVRSLSNNQRIDIRDMDEATDENDIIYALQEATKCEDPDVFKILNIRESYGQTRQALVQLPSHYAGTLLQEKKIRVGWVMCRVRAKVKIIKCFKCLEQGHYAKDCTGVDRSALCKRCCKTGHKSKDCDQQLNCIICQELGVENTQHFIGSNICLRNRITSI